jgi:hypothetical protein
MKKPFWVLENIDPTARRRLFTWWGVEWLATRYAWLSLLTFGAVGLALAALLGGRPVAPGFWRAGLAYGLLFYSTNVVHTLGHVLGGRLVGRPMQANLLTASFDVNVYTGDQSGYTRRVHLGRALGGPLLNLVSGLVSLALWRWLGWTWLLISGYMHLVGGLSTLFPIAPMDGWVIWQNSRPRPPAGRQDR